MNDYQQFNIRLEGHVWAVPRASAVSVANVRRASMSGSVAETLKQATLSLLENKGSRVFVGFIMSYISGNSFFKNVFHPENWGFMIQYDEHIF